MREREQATKIKKIVKSAARSKLGLSETSSSLDSGQLQRLTPVSSSSDSFVFNDVSCPLDTPVSSWSRTTPQRSFWSELSDGVSFDLDQSTWNASEISDIILGDASPNSHGECK